MGLKNFIVLTLSVSLVIGVTLIAGCVRDETVTIENITPQEAFTLIQNNRNNSDFVILDVRTREEFSAGHIENAINMVFRSETLRDELNKLDKNKTYLVYCACPGRGISGVTIDMMEELNFREAYLILGGINQWKAEGLPTAK